MNKGATYVVLSTLVLFCLLSASAQAQVSRDTYVVSTGFGSTLSEEGSWGRAHYLHLWSGIVAWRPGQWRPYASVSIPIHALYQDQRWGYQGQRSDRYELSAVNLGGTYSINGSLTGYLGGGWTRLRGIPRFQQFEPVEDGFKENSLNVSAGLLIHLGGHLGVNAALGANPGTASLSVNFRF